MTYTCSGNVKWRTVLAGTLIAGLLVGLCLPATLAGNSPSVQAAPFFQPTACTGTVIAEWTFDDLPIPVPTTIPTPDIGVGSLNKGSDLLGPLFYTGYGAAGAAISFSGWETTAIRSDGNYIELQFDASGRQSIKLTFDERRTETGPKKYEVVDASTNLTLGNPQDIPEDSVWRRHEINLGNFDNVSSVTIRIYGYTAAGGDGEWKFDNIRVTGDCLPSQQMQTDQAASLTANQASTRTATFFPTSTNVPSRYIIINEVAWAGTGHLNDLLTPKFQDEWIELYNPNSQAVQLKDWCLAVLNNDPLKTSTPTPSTTKSPTCSIRIDKDVSIAANGYALLERANDYVVSNIPADFVYAGTELNYMDDNGGKLLLLSPSGLIVDTANGDGGVWPAGSSNPLYGSMERITGMTDVTSAWMTNIFSNDIGLSGDEVPRAIFGTPKNKNFALSITPTVTRTPTLTRTATLGPTRTPTYTPTLITDYVILNEVNPWPDKDHNGDGLVDFGDEYIELVNLSNFAVQLSGWYLDDGDPSTPTFPIPQQIISPGQKLSFFASQTRIYLSNGGDTVRLIRPGGATADIYSYTFAGEQGSSYCRLPDGTGIWFSGCAATPNLANAPRPAVTPTPTPVVKNEMFSAYADCPLEKANPYVQYAECEIYGLDIYNPEYWNAQTPDVFWVYPE